MKKHQRLSDLLLLILSSLLLLLAAVDAFLFDIPFLHTGPVQALSCIALLLAAAGAILRLRRQDGPTKGDPP